MIVFQVTGEDVKKMMRHLLREETFDHFEVRGVEIAAMTKFQISGDMDKGFLNEGAEQSEGNAALYCTWRVIRPIAFYLVKGKKRPKSIKLTLSLPAGQTAALHPNAAAYFLNLHYENDEILCTTGTSEKRFAMDKAVDAAWDDDVRAFFARTFGIRDMAQ